jgi:hypothetical protein
VFVARHEFTATQRIYAAVTEEARRRAPEVPEPVRDAEGFELRPDPLTARTPAELVAFLQWYREWAGQPSFRKMAAQAGQRVSYSALCTALRGDAMPGYEIVKAVIAGCGGSDEEQQR